MAYGRMALIYDRLMRDAPYDDWVSFTEKHLTKKNADILELGCGTGEITLRLAEKGHRVTGVDVSGDMLTVANEKAAEALNIKWLRQDIRSLEGLENFDCVVSYCDVLNYMNTHTDLLRVFHHAFEAIKPGGCFIFDVHSIEHLSRDMAGETFAEVYDDISYIWFCNEGDRINQVEHDLTFFIEENGVYERFDEYHYQTGYAMADLNALLNETGFEHIQAFADFSGRKAMDDSAGDRLFFVCEKS
ncbi:class I SAM-dependent DNA methyltransferase [Thalassobacillus pellis]|uniref:class I SAM-dependent DNA methyltransferase n=1 Tax=Thalassobacillus pellis TaxID=748008 RepID=UPI001961CDF8|nr:class I SAM-dependent methyltransferase [Thalassobacillus pellis]MBM7554698.1 SAM-dependent methyltransferase [Thalassobacillus pellis]